ncbi:hypothetical protein HU200_000512 [Digitaria exilis]|uniref:Peptidase A1 domain-containing protein n=1 Tax=Digitaria exilis TaxID=1010633 RepID=A0A835G2W1_9POAL|nr:hypothetical protein HU200_000512 [Digitaria exilis]
MLLGRDPVGTYAPLHLALKKGKPWPSALQATATGQATAAPIASVAPPRCQVLVPSAMASRIYSRELPRLSTYAYDPCHGATSLLIATTHSSAAVFFSKVSTNQQPSVLFHHGAMLRSAMASAAPSPIYSLLLFLLLLPHLTAALPKPPARVRYHTLRATPLSPEPIARADAAAISGDANSEAILQHTTNSTTVQLLLTHRDAFAPPNATAPQILAHLLARDAVRADAISAAAASAGAATNGTKRAPRRPSRGGFAAPVVSGLSKGSGEYFAQVGVGTPSTPALLVLDTGSDVVWLQCAPCQHCYAQSGRVFDPRRSRSYATVPCAAPLCHRLDTGGCDRRRGSCLYQVAYGDGSVTSGDLATETLSFARGARVERVAIGCGHDNEGLFVAAAGLLGLGRGRLSLPTQVARRYGRSFSYCLVDRTSSVKPSSTRSSTLTFGSGALGARASSFTPMVRNPRMATFYYVSVTGFSVGGARVRGVSERDLRLDPATGRGGVIVDSGTSVTRLARPVYAALRDAFRAAAGGLRLRPGGFSLFDTCYDLGGRRVVKVPTMSVHLAGGAAVALPPENYLIPVDTRGTFCFALAGTDGGVSILGNIQQQGFRVVFDGDAQRVGLNFTSRLLHLSRYLPTSQEHLPSAGYRGAVRMEIEREQDEQGLKIDLQRDGLGPPVVIIMTDAWLDLAACISWHDPIMVSSPFLSLEKLEIWAVSDGRPSHQLDTSRPRGGGEAEHHRRAPRGNEVTVAGGRVVEPWLAGDGWLARLRLTACPLMWETDADAHALQRPNYTRGAFPALHVQISKCTVLCAVQMQGIV